MADDFINYGIKLPHRRTAEVATTCPQCSHNRKKANQNKPCLAVNIEKGTWFCHHCRWTGGIKQNNTDTQPTYTPNTKPKATPKDKTPHKKPPELAKDLSQQAIEWFKKRGISSQTLDVMHIKSGSIFMPQLQKKVNAIQFPYYKYGQLVNIKYRDHQKNFRFGAGCEQLFYNFDILEPDSEYVVIVEGEMDVLSMMETEYYVAISVPAGAPNPNSEELDRKFEFMESCQEKLEGIPLVYIAVDNDEAGLKLRDELMHRIGRYKCKLVHWPPGCKDANEVLVKHGKETLEACIQKAESPGIPGVNKVSELKDKLLSYYREGMRPGVKSGWDNLDKLYRVCDGQLTIVTGIPGHGKSEFLDALLVQLATTHGHKFGIFSPENYPLEQHIAKLTEKKLGRCFSARPDRPDTALLKMSEQELIEASDWTNNHFYFIRCDDEGVTVDHILDLTREMIFCHGIKGLVIDPWNEIEHNQPDKMTETNYISKVLSQLRNFARKYGVHIWVVAHPGKLQKDKDGNEPVPTGYTISGSSNWYNKADNIMCIWRNKKDRKSPVFVYIQKIKFKKDGELGRASFSYDTITGRYTPCYVQGPVEIEVMHTL